MGRVREVNRCGYLLDTHVLLWSLNGDPQAFAVTISHIIEAGENLTVSVVSHLGNRDQALAWKTDDGGHDLANIRSRPMRILPVDANTRRRHGSAATLTAIASIAC